MNIFWIFSIVFVIFDFAKCDIDSVEENSFKKIDGRIIDGDSWWVGSNTECKQFYSDMNN